MKPVVSILALLMVSACAANPQIELARNAALPFLDCEGGRPEVVLAEEHEGYREWFVGCDYNRVRVHCDELNSCGVVSHRRFGWGEMP